MTKQMMVSNLAMTFSPRSGERFEISEVVELLEDFGELISAITDDQAPGSDIAWWVSELAVSEFGDITVGLTAGRKVTR